MTPAISVIMPVYNSSLFLTAAVDSIINQTFTDFELLIFNDGSTDDSREIILNYNDARLIFYDDERNIGYTRRLNQGLSVARGKYIARMDSDDISLPDRFEKQYTYLEAHQDVLLCGSFFNFIGIDDKYQRFNWVKYSDPELLKINLLFDCAICHPTVMIRRADMEQKMFRYDIEFEPSEDYELWARIAEDHKVINLSDVLLHYRINENQVSNRNNDKQRANKFKIISRQLKLLSIEADDISLRIHDHLFFGRAILSADYLPKIKNWIDRLISANNLCKIYNPVKFKDYLNLLLMVNQASFKQQLDNATLRSKVQYFIKSAVRWQSIR